jgi:hypothetical protein
MLLQKVKPYSLIYLPTGRVAQPPSIEYGLDLVTQLLINRTNKGKSNSSAETGHSPPETGD